MSNDEYSKFPRLALGELEALAGALLAVLLAFVRARIARKETKFLQLRTKFAIELQQRTRNTQPGGFCLTRKATAVGKDEDIKLVGRLGGEQGLPHDGAGRFRVEVVLEGAVIDGNVALTRTQENASCGGFPAAGS